MTTDEAVDKIIEYCQEIDWYAMHISDVKKGIKKILESYERTRPRL